MLQKSQMRILNTLKRPRGSFIATEHSPVCVSVYYIVYTDDKNTQMRSDRMSTVPGDHIQTVLWWFHYKPNFIVS